MSSALDNSEFIKLIKNIDFAKGFSSWHIKWSLKTPLSTSYSNNFVTNVEQETETSSYQWYLGLLKDETKAKLWLGLFSENPQEMIPVIFRFVLQHPGKEPFFNRGSFYVYSPKPGLQPAFGLSIDEARLIDQKIIVHCWIDIPTDIVNCKMIRNNKDQSNRLPAVTTNLFKGVIGENRGLAAFSDVTLLVSKNQAENQKSMHRFYCDRHILAALSTVFEQLFIDYEKNKNANETERKIEIKNIDKETMEIVLEYIYTDRLPDKSCGKLVEIISAADEYKLIELKDWCATCLVIWYGGDTSRVESLRLADRYELHQLKAVCIASLCTNLAIFENVELRDKIPENVFSELIKASARRNLESTEMCVSSKI